MNCILSGLNFSGLFASTCVIGKKVTREVPRIFIRSA